MKTPGKEDIVVGSVLIVVWLSIAFCVTGYNLERAGAVSIGAIVGIIFSMFGVSALKSWKNAVVIMGVSFLSTMMYDIVASVIHHLN